MRTLTSRLLAVPLLLATASFLVGCGGSPEKRLLVFTKTAGYRHASINNGVAAIERLGQQQGFSVDTTSDGASFTESNLARYQTVVFLSTTGDILDEQQQNAFERYVQAGGGFVGIHGAADAEYGWPWYNRLVGAYF